MIDTKTPISIAIYTLVISFILFIILFYIVKPSWVQIVILNQNDEKPVISNILVISYSITFSLVCAIAAVLFCKTKKNNPYGQNIIEPIDTTLFSNFY